MNQKSTKFQHGSREVSVSVTGASEWEKSAMKRTYLDLSFTGAKLPPIESLYEVTGGGTKDATITVHGRTFGYSLGISCDSKTKRAAAVVAIEELLAVFAAPAAPAAIIAPAAAIAPIAPIADADLTEYPAPAKSFSADGYEYDAIGFVNVGGGNPIAWSMSRNGRNIATRVIPAQLSPACVAASFAHYRDFFERSTWIAVPEEAAMTKQEFFASIEPAAEEIAQALALAQAQAEAEAQARAEAEALALAEAEKARAAAEAEQIVIREMPERGIVCTVDRSAVVYVNGHAATEPRRLPSGEYFVWAPKAAGLPLGVKIMLSQQVISKIEAHAAEHYAAEAAHLAEWRATTKQAQAHNNSQNEGREGFNRYYD